MIQLNAQVQILIILEAVKISVSTPRHPPTHPPSHTHIRMYLDMFCNCSKISTYMNVSEYIYIYIYIYSPSVDLSDQPLGYAVDLGSVVRGGATVSRDSLTQLPGKPNCHASRAKLTHLLEPQGAVLAGPNTPRRGYVYFRAPEASLFRRLPTGPEAFLCSPRRSGLWLCSWNHRNLGFVPYSLVRWGVRQISEYTHTYIYYK